MIREENYTELPQSERVRHLLTVAIQVAARIELGVTLDHGQASELARNHALVPAMEKLREKLMLHANVNERLRTKLAAAEAAMISAEGDSSNVSAIIKVRQETQRVSAQNVSGQLQFSTLEDHRKQLQDGLTSWSDSARRFYRNVNDLYRRRRGELDGLALPGDVRAAAQEELDQMFAKYIGQFAEL
jgi:hypothetical protein